MANTFTKAFYGKEVNYDLMHETLQHPGWAIFYIICIIAVVFHFANGLWSFLVTWGGLQSPKSQRVFTWVSLIVFFSYFVYWCYCNYCLYVIHRI